MIEEKKRREREMLKKALANGVDYLGDNNIKFTKKKEFSFLEILKNSLLFIVRILTPLKKDLNHLRIVYD
jgi:hypothetical protein